MPEEFLSNKTALVTSASRALGAAIAESLAGYGAQVAVNYYSSKAEAESLVESMNEASGETHYAVWGNTETSDGVRELVASASEALGGGIDILVNNSGPYSGTPLLELSESEWDRVIDANLKASFVASKMCVPFMREKGWGRIVNLSAVSANVRNRSVYALAKNAVEMLTEELALECAPEVTVNAVAPGQIAESAEDMEDFYPGWVEEARERTPLGRLGHRAEIANVVALMCGPAFDMLTGATVPLDGGLRFHTF